MICPGCGQASPAGAQFCGSCGRRLAAVCSSCQVANPPGNRFCHQCGAALSTPTASVPTASPAPSASPVAYTPRHLAEKILIGAGALQGERKQVTVLFVDVSGFTSLSERLDPEDHMLLGLRIDRALEWNEIASILDKDAATLRKRFERLKTRLTAMAAEILDDAG